MSAEHHRPPISAQNPRPMSIPFHLIESPHRHGPESRATLAILARNIAGNIMSLLLDVRREAAAAEHHLVTAGECSRKRETVNTELTMPASRSNR